MKLKKIILIGLILLLSLMSYLVYFAIDFNEYFLGYNYNERYGYFGLTMPAISVSWVPLKKT